MFTLRLRFPPGYAVPPHSTPLTSNVQSSPPDIAWHGPRVRPRRMATLVAGAFANAPGGHGPLRLDPLRRRRPGHQPGPVCGPLRQPRRRHPAARVIPDRNASLPSARPCGGATMLLSMILLYRLLPHAAPDAGLADRLAYAVVANAFASLPLLAAIGAWECARHQRGDRPDAWQGKPGADRHRTKSSITRSSNSLCSLRRPWRCPSISSLRNCMSLPLRRSSSSLLACCSGSAIGSTPPTAPSDSRRLFTSPSACSPPHCGWRSVESQRERLARPLGHRRPIALARLVQRLLGRPQTGRRVLLSSLRYLDRFLRSIDRLPTRPRLLLPPLPLARGVEEACLSSSHSPTPDMLRIAPARFANHLSRPRQRFLHQRRIGDHLRGARREQIGPAPPSEQRRLPARRRHISIMKPNRRPEDLKFSCPRFRHAVSTRQRHNLSKVEHFVRSSSRLSLAHPFVTPPSSP